MPWEGEVMQTEEEKEKFAFVLMPFDSEFDGIYADLIVPGLEAAGFVKLATATACSSKGGPKSEDKRPL